MIREYDAVIGKSRDGRTGDAASLAALAGRGTGKTWGIVNHGSAPGSVDGGKTT